MKLNLEIIEEPGGVDMCKSMERRMQQERVTGAIKAFKLDGASDEDIVAKVTKLFNVTKEYVLALLAPQRT